MYATDTDTASCTGVYFKLRESSCMIERRGVFQSCQGKMYAARLEEFFVAETARPWYTLS